MREEMPMKHEASICVTPRLSEQQRREIEALGRACRAWEPVTQEPFLDEKENADPSLPCFYIYYENSYPVSFLSLFVPDGSFAEITGFTLPGYRKKGHFSELLACVKEEWKERNPEFYLVSDGKSPDAKAMLLHMDLKPDYSERMMAASLGELANLKVGPQEKEDERGTETSEKGLEIRVISEGDEYRLRQGDREVGHCRLVCFAGSGTLYLYGFEIEESMRRQGFGRRFLKLLAAEQANRAHTMLLQVSSRNEAACALYEACGFRITEQLDYYNISDRMR